MPHQPKIHSPKKYGTIQFYFGAADPVTHPFLNHASLVYNLSLFPNTTIQADQIDSCGDVPGNRSNVNLDGALST
jgi:hypothetical protein